MSTRIVVRDADGGIVRTFFDSSTNADFRNGGYSGARKAFASKKFDKATALGAGEQLVLLVGDEVKLAHPDAKKGKRKAGTPKAGAKKAKVDTEEKKPKVEAKKGPSEAGWTPPAAGGAPEAEPSPAKKTCTPSMLLSMRMKSGKPPVELPPKPKEDAWMADAPKKKKASRKKVVVESESEEERDTGRPAEEDSEEEFDLGAAEAEEEEEEEDPGAPEVADLVPGANPARAWGAFAEREVEPEAGDALGDEWSDDRVGPCERPCRHVSVVKALTAPELARRFHDEGVLLLESSKWAVARGDLKTLKGAVADHYATKLAEAQENGLTKGGKAKHVLKATETETLAGFNQRPGGRIDMVLDELEAVKAFEGEWPWSPVVRSILGPRPSLNYVGCVVSRPGDSVQNWHIDGVHTVKDRHAAADRIIVFCALTDLTEATGCTEFVPKSHFESRDKQAKFPRVSHMRRARHYVHAGTPIIMDYRLWHRGLPNTGDKERYLMYCVYQDEASKHDMEDNGGLREALGKDYRE